MPQYRTMGLPKLTGHTDKDIKNLRDLFYQQDEQLRYLFEHLGTDIASEIWENDNQSVKIKIDEDGIIAEIRESLDGDLKTLSTKINITAGKINTTVSRVENIERDYVSDETLAGILSEYVTDDDIDNVYLSLKTEIDQNAEAIALRATKEYVVESLNGYVTETELAAELKVSSDGVLTTVSKSYATTDAVNTAQNTANAAGAAAAGAQNTANNAQNAADAVAANLSNNYYAKTTIDQKFDGITLKYTDSLGNETSFKLTNGAIDISLLKNQVDDAAKTATNFISMRSDGGVEVGNKSGGNWTGYRSQMLADSFNIVDENGALLAMYGANSIDLGMNEEDSVINFCGGAANISFSTKYDSVGINSNGFYVRSTGRNVALSVDTTIGGNQYNTDIDISGGRYGLSLGAMTTDVESLSITEHAGIMLYQGSVELISRYHNINLNAPNVNVYGDIKTSDRMRASGDVPYLAYSSDDAYAIGFGVGGGNVNRGIYDYTRGHWTLYNDDSHTTLQSIKALFFIPHYGQTTNPDSRYFAIGVADTTNGPCFRPDTNGWGTIGSNGLGVKYIYATNTGIISTSDGRLKENISDDFSKLEKAFGMLHPVTYDYKHLENDDNMRIGFIAQEVWETIEACGIDPYRFAAIHMEKVDPKTDIAKYLDTDETYYLNYTEFTALNTYMIQKLMKRIEELEKRIA